MDVRRRLGLNLKKLREEQGFSQESFADHCGLHRTYISGIERGVRNPTVIILDKIAKALKVAAGILLDETRNKFERSLECSSTCICDCRGESVIYGKWTKKEARIPGGGDCDCALGDLIMRFSQRSPRTYRQVGFKKIEPVSGVEGRPRESNRESEEPTKPAHRDGEGQ